MRVDAGHRSLRRDRSSEAGRAYLVTFTTFERQPVFRDFRSAQVACRAITNSLPVDDGTLVCWVPMPDHFHAVLRLTGRATLSRCVQRLKGRSSMACRATMGSSPAPIWARAFHDHAVRADEDLATLTRHVIANPLRAGLVDDPLDYPFWNAEWL